MLNASMGKASKSTEGKSRKSITLDTETNEIQIDHTKDLRDQGDFRVERFLFLDDGDDKGDDRRDHDDGRDRGDDRRDRDDGRDGDLRMTRIGRESMGTFNVKIVNGKTICYHDGDDGDQ